MWTIGQELEKIRARFELDNITMEHRPGEPIQVVTIRRGPISYQTLRSDQADSQVRKLLNTEIPGNPPDTTQTPDRTGKPERPAAPRRPGAQNQRAATGIQARIFHWADRDLDVWVIAGLVPHGKNLIWYPLGVTTDIGHALDSVMDLNKNTSWRKS